MAIEIAAGLGLFKGLYDSAKALKDINDATVRNAAVIDLQERILVAQAAQSDLVERVRELKEEVRSFEKWETEKKRYELKDLGWGALAYMLKPAMRESTPPHWACTNCYGNDHISIIQHIFVRGEGQRYICPMCKTTLSPQPTSVATDGSAKWLD